VSPPVQECPLAAPVRITAATAGSAQAWLKRAAISSSTVWAVHAFIRCGRLIVTTATPPSVA